MSPNHSSAPHSEPRPDPRHPPRTSQLPETIRTTLIGVVFSGVVIGMGGMLIHASSSAKAEVARRQVEAHNDLIAAAPLPMLEVERAAHGRDLFLGTCVTCHGPEGKGVPGLGKNLSISPLVASLDDASLVRLISTGRPQGKPVPMPPKGGNDALSASDVADIAYFLRGVQDPRRMPNLPAPIAAAPSEADKAAALAAAGGDADLAEFIAHGSQIFAMTCSACHGKDAKGLKGNGKDLIHSEFSKSLSDDDLLAFLKKGRDPGDPANTTGVGMPPKGGNPALSDDDLLDVIDYLRSLQTASK